MSTVATFSIEYTQFLNAQGELTQALPEFAKNTKTLIHLYREMVLTRTFDSKAIALQRTGKMGTYASILGQEAISVGMGHAMKKEDVLCPYYRDYGAQFARGVSMTEILTYWGGDERGNQYANCHDFPICVPIATQTLHAAGIATAFKLRNEARVAVTTLGDGATSEGDFYEAINLAGAWKLPVIFVVNNNQWAISIPRSAQTSTQTLAQKAIAGGISGEQVDGNDIIAIQFVMERALEKARKGEGASLIEAITYRLHDHTTADDANRYRAKEELQRAWEEEPILRLRKYLTSQNAWSTEQEETLLAECTAKVEKAVEAYLNRGTPPITDMFDYHYANLPADLAEQRAYAMTHVTEGNDHGH